MACGSEGERIRSRPRSPNERSHRDFLFFQTIQANPQGHHSTTVGSDYADKIDALYGSGDQGDVARIAKDATCPDVEAYITKTLLDILTVLAIDENADIFALGVDSLQTLRLGQILQGALQASLPDLTAAEFNSQQIYSHPGISQLPGYVYDPLQGQDSPPAAAVIESDTDRAARLATLVGKYSDGIGESHAVTPTGSTGSLGGHLLHELIRDCSVSKIYCLNRSADAALRQLLSLHEKGLETFDKFPRRVEFLRAQFGAERLGLDEFKYDELLQVASRRGI